MDEKVRAFVAIELPETIRQELSALQSVFKPLLSHAKVSWVRPPNLHLTLRFFGACTQDQISRIIDSCAWIASVHAVDLYLDRIGFFPNERKLRVFWCGYAPSEPLMRLQEKIEKTALENGFQQEDKKFSPHVTLARIKETKMNDTVSKKIKECVDACKLALAHRVDSVTFFRSRLTSRGPEYEILKEFRLMNGEFTTSH